MTLSETGRKLYDLIDKYNSQLCSSSLNDQNEKINKKNSGQLSNSSSTSSAMSSISGGTTNDAANSDVYIRNKVASNIITYCYDIAYTVKKIVCVIGAGN